jgi:hypothetical protein
MPRPIKRRELIRPLQMLGWVGPERVVHIPSCAKIADDSLCPILTEATSIGRWSNEYCRKRALAARSGTESVNRCAS